MTLYRKSGAVGGGSWVALAAGHVNQKRSGSFRTATAPPSVGSIFVKIGGVGGGYWYDSGYQGVPSYPYYLRILKETASTIDVGWDPGPGGAPLVSPGYWYVQTEWPLGGGGGGTVVAQGPSYTNYHTFNVVAARYYEFKVKALAAGMESVYNGIHRGTGAPPSAANNFYW